MKITEFIKQELSGWKNYEIAALFFISIFIIINAIILKDSLIAVYSALCGIFYTIIAGKGKISCYIFGLSGSFCYVFLSYSNALWGNMLLYLCYYIPMEIVGIFRWKKHLSSGEIIKTELSNKERLILIITSVPCCAALSLILAYFNDKSPVIDGITVFLSILGMYLTVKRAIEQWIVWIIVNALSLIMWINLIIQGAKAYSTVIMWAVYLILALYFYKEWKNQILCR